MPFETHKIALSEDELLHAVELLQCDHPTALRSGSLVAVRIHEGQIESTFRPLQEASKPIVVTFTRDLAIETLVHFCLKEEIPLPSRSDKMFRVVTGRATLLIEGVVGRSAKAAHLTLETAHTGEGGHAGLRKADPVL